MTRIEISLVAVIQKPARLLPGNVIRRNGRTGDVEYRPVWIQPGVELHAALVRFFHHELQWIIIWLRGLALNARQPLAPGLIRRRIKGIRRRPDLHDDGIHSIGAMQIEYLDEFRLLLSSRQPLAGRPVNIVDRSDPGTPELMTRGYLLLRKRHTQQPLQDDDESDDAEQKTAAHGKNYMMRHMSKLRSSSPNDPLEDLDRNDSQTRRCRSASGSSDS